MTSPVAMIVTGASPSARNSLRGISLRLTISPSGTQRALTRLRGIPVLLHRVAWKMGVSTGVVFLVGMVLVWFGLDGAELLPAAPSAFAEEAEREESRPSGSV